MPRSSNTPSSPLIYLDIFRRATNQSLTISQLHKILKILYKDKGWAVPKKNSLRRTLRLMRDNGLISSESSLQKINNLTVTTNTYHLEIDDPERWENIYREG